jgi:hypothetical protein
VTPDADSHLHLEPRRFRRHAMASIEQTVAVIRSSALPVN